MVKTILFSFIFCLLFTAMLHGNSVHAAESDTAVASDSSEAALRQHFLQVYGTAKTPGDRAATLKMLQGAKEQSTLRVLTGMLGDTSELVRLEACAVMILTPDPDGFFVKPLMGTLMDKSEAVRISAAEALGAASIKGDAVKALTLALSTAIDQSDKNEHQMTANSIHAYDSALERLTGAHSPDRKSLDLSSFWNSYWHHHEDELRAADRKQLEKEPTPRPKDLPPDSLDKQK